MLLYSVFTFLFTVFVIIWGALVRATHSGAGCGKHWPLCNGEVLPLSSELETLIEFTHRSTSGISVLFVLFLFYLTVRKYPRGSFSRSAAGHALFFMMIEVAIGAGIVLFGWVKDDTSGVRAAMVAFHLINSFLLIGALAAHVMSVYYDRVIYLKKSFLCTGTWNTRMLLFAFLLTGSAGAITALGDTLFPPESVRSDFYMYLSSANHFLVQLRVIHPVMAILLSLFILLYALQMNERFALKSGVARVFSCAVICFLSLQLVIGPLTILFLAPLGLQLLHLGVSVFLWSTLVVLVFEDEFLNH
jgi:heme A synthase